MLVKRFLEVRESLKELRVLLHFSLHELLFVHLQLRFGVEPIFNQMLPDKLLLLVIIRVGSSGERSGGDQGQRSQ